MTAALDQRITLINSLTALDEEMSAALKECRAFHRLLQKETHRALVWLIAEHLALHSPELYRSVGKDYLLWLAAQNYPAAAVSECLTQLRSELPEGASQ